MDKMQPYFRWIAIAGGLGALAYAFFMPRHDDSAAPTDAAATPPAALVATADPSAVTAVAASSPTPIAGDLAVYVCGAVRKSGVYHLPQGSRVVDAVRLAGGLSADADPEAINLASPLTDGMKVDVLKRGAHASADALAVDVPGAPPHAAAHRRSSSRGSSHKLAAGQTLDINTAAESELTQLPGVGPSLARRIVEYRQANGPFETIDDLQNVSGIGPSKFAKMEPFVTL